MLSPYRCPLVFKSYLRPQIWGSDGLHRQLNKPHPNRFKIGEAWELSTLPEHVSRVAEGAWSGVSLQEFWTQSQGGPSGNGTSGAEFPWLVKWLDCAGDLSLQVHPDDSMARAVLGQSHGKSEAWVVVHVEQGAKIHAGLRNGVTREMFEASLADGSIGECLHSFDPHVGDCVSLPAGTVHTACGVVLAEVQQLSDATFRLYDWNRLDESGRTRPLHHNWGLQAIYWKQGPINPVVPQRLASQQSGVLREALLTTSWVQLERLVIERPCVSPHIGEISVWMVLDGNLELIDRTSESRLKLSRGSTVVIPAAATGVSWVPTTCGKRCQLLCIRESREAMFKAAG